MSLDSSIPSDILYKGVTSLFDMEFSNLPLDYFLGVLPSPQFGDESAVSVTSSTDSVGLSVSGKTKSPDYDPSVPLVPMMAKALALLLMVL